MKVASAMYERQAIQNLLHYISDLVIWKPASTSIALVFTKVVKYRSSHVFKDEINIILFHSYNFLQLDDICMV